MNDDDIQILHCPGCNADLEMDTAYYRELAGTEISCPACETPLAVPPLEPEPETPKPLGLRSASPPPRSEDDADGPARCPTCGEDFPEPNAVLCMACGTNRSTGEQITGLESSRKKRTQTTPRQAVTGVIAVMVIIVCAVRGYVLLAQKQRTTQSENLAVAINSSYGSHDYAVTVARLESALQKTPRAVNRLDAEDALAEARRNLAEVPARTETLRVEIERAREENDRAQAIRILDEALQLNPGAENEKEAADLLVQLRNAR